MKHPNIKKEQRRIFYFSWFSRIGNIYKLKANYVCIPSHLPFSNIPSTSGTGRQVYVITVLVGVRDTSCEIFSLCQTQSGFSVGCGGVYGLGFWSLLCYGASISMPWREQWRNWNPGSLSPSVLNRAAWPWRKPPNVFDSFLLRNLIWFYEDQRI